MALIRRFIEVDAPAHLRVHTEVDCGYKIVNLEGRVLLQLNTYGSRNREVRGAASQLIQLDEEGARDLMGIVRRAFPNL